MSSTVAPLAMAMAPLCTPRPPGPSTRAYSDPTGPGPRAYSDPHIFRSDRVSLLRAVFCTQRTLTGHILQALECTVCITGLHFLKLPCIALNWSELY